VVRPIGIKDEPIKLTEKIPERPGTATVTQGAEG
jgi:hypothetical protein